MFQGLGLMSRCFTSPKLWGINLQQIWLKVMMKIPPKGTFTNPHFCDGSFLLGSLFPTRLSTQEQQQQDMTETGDEATETVVISSSGEPKSQESRRNQYIFHPQKIRKNNLVNQQSYGNTMETTIFKK